MAGLLATHGEGALEGDLVPPDALDGVVRDGRLAVLEDGVDIDGLPGDGSLFSRGLGAYRCGVGGARMSGSWAATDLGGGEDVLDSNGNLGANAVTLDQADGVAALQERVSRLARLAELWAVLSRCWLE